MTDSAKTESDIFHYEKDADHIVTVTMDMPGAVNTMNQACRDALAAVVARLEAERELRGVIFASAKTVFLAGGDIAELFAFERGQEAQLMVMADGVKDCFRRLEKLPVPVVAAINGAALGGGFELALACNHRIAVNHKSVQLGLPEVSLGLLPAAGGIVRLVNLIGLQKALPYLLDGGKLTPDAALAAGLIDEVVEAQEQLLPCAKAWLLENAENSQAAVQPWDNAQFQIPGGRSDAPELAETLVQVKTDLLQKTRGLLPAPERIFDCAVAAASSDFGSALHLESEGLAYLAGTAVAKNLINTFFFQMNQINGGASRPQAFAKSLIKKVGVIGAGMMGQGIAYASAIVGIDVVLKDVALAAAEKGKSYSEKILAKRVAKGLMSEAEKDGVLARIKATDSDDDLQGCDLIIEAVFEDIDLKKKITGACEQYLANDGIWASNTSTLPITRLATASNRPENFIGLHFFSPVDRMPLVEIICGEKTSDATLAKAFDFTRQIRKTPIVVNDSLGFFTSRTIFTYLDEAARLVSEGADPVQIDAAGRAIGMPVGPLAVHDEVSLRLTHEIANSQEAEGVLFSLSDTSVLRDVVRKMVTEHARGGRHHGGGYYEYGVDDKKIWPKLYELFYRPDYQISADDMQDRLLFRQVIETAKCLQENVLRSAADGNIGSLLGIGAPAWTGGFIQFINTYGVDKFVKRAHALAAQYGKRFEPPRIAIEKAQSNTLF